MALSNIQMEKRNNDRHLYEGYIFKDKPSYEKGEALLEKLGYKLISRNRTLVYFMKEDNTSSASNIIFDIACQEWEAFKTFSIQVIDEANIAFSRLSITNELDIAIYFIKKGLGWF